MPFLTLKVPAESFLVHRGLNVFHVYRNDAFPDRYECVYSLCADEEALDYQFDVRELPGAEDPQADPAVLIRRTLDRSLDAGEAFPYAGGPGPLPDGTVNAAVQDQPDDWDLLDFLASLGGRTEPFAQRLTERHAAGLVQLVALAGKLAPLQRASLEQWLRG